jgi:hypothetical protein
VNSCKWLKITSNTAVAGLGTGTNPHCPGLSSGRAAPRSHSLGDTREPARKLARRCAHRADGAPGSIRRRFRRSERICGQGRGRTADLPLFRRTLVPTELPDLGDVALGATSAVLTGFEPATSTLTGWRALHAALQDHLLPPTLADDAPRRGSARGKPPAPERAYHRNARGRVQLPTRLSRRGRRLP